MGSLKSSCTTSYRSLTDTIALTCLVFEKIAVFVFWRQTDRQTNKQTNKQTDSTNAPSRSRCRDRRLKKQNKNKKIWRKLIFNMADGITTPYNAKLSILELWCGTIMTLISPGDCTLQCGMWLWNHDSEFTKWQHTAMWYVALGWQAIEFARWQHHAMWHALNSPGGSTLQCGRWFSDDMPWNSPKRPPYWNSTSGFDFDHITAVDMSFCTSLRNFIKIGPPSAEKNWRHVDFFRWRFSAILDFRGPIMGSLKSPCMTSCRSSIDNIALKCLVCEKIAFFAFWRQTD